MNALQIGRRRFSKLFWEIVATDINVDWGKDSIDDILSNQEQYRENAEYKTGSISYDDALDLYVVTRYFNPWIIAEVGTFIGNSTVTMRHAAPDCEIYTCDISNKICVSPGDQNIHHYYKTPSHVMFKDMADKGIKANMVYLDGRLSAEDLEPLSKIIFEETIFVLDDFEGTEKGVANAMLLGGLGGPSRTLIYPNKDHKTALVLPFHVVQFVPQEAT